MEGMLISVIIPVYNEAEGLPTLFEALEKLKVQYPDRHFEFVLVDDGSRDGSYAIMQQLGKNKSDYVLAQLCRNFGSHAALRAGMTLACGDYMAFISADLQDPPEMAVKMLDAALTENVGLVWGQRLERKDPWHKSLAAGLFYKLIQRYVFPNLPEGGVDVFLMSRAVMLKLQDLKEKNTVPYYQLLWMGVPFTSVGYVRAARQHGVTKWSFAKRLKMAIDVFFLYSYLPLRLVSYAGMILTGAGFVWAIVILYLHMIQNAAQPGWASLMLAILFFSGLQLIFLGVIGEYLWRISEQGRGRPDFYLETVADHRSQS